MKITRFIVPCLTALSIVIGSTSCTPPAAPNKTTEQPPVEPATEVPAPAMPKTMESPTLGSLQPLTRVGTVWLGGQPTPDDLKRAKEAGINTVINLREAAELDWNEGAVAKAEGLGYHNIAFKAPETLTDGVIEESIGLLNNKQNQPVLLHCKSANRVGAIWLAHRVLNDKVAIDEALAEAKAAGLRSPEYEATIKDYIERKQQQ